MAADTATFRRDWPASAREVRLDEIVRVEVLRNGRLAFWFADPSGEWAEDDLEVTRVIYVGDQPKRLREAVRALEARGWRGQVGSAPEPERRRSDRGPQ